MTAVAGADYWDSFFRKLRESGGDLDWEGRWVDAFLAPLRDAHVQTILELGSGTGNDAARLADEGYAVTAIDISSEAVMRARSRFGSRVSFLIADMTSPLPFPAGGFDAVMSNVAVHMFPGRVTRSVFGEIARVVRPDGLFVFHVNALEDRPLRERWRPVAQELEPNYVLERSGQTMHFFSRDYLGELLQPWREVRLEPVEITRPSTRDRSPIAARARSTDAGEPFKRIWRGVARR
jgi:SAM-dependent methyltransferase